MTHIKFVYQLNIQLMGAVLYLRPRHIRRHQLVAASFRDPIRTIYNVHSGKHRSMCMYIWTLHTCAPSDLFVFIFSTRMHTLCWRSKYT